MATQTVYQIDGRTVTKAEYDESIRLEKQRKAELDRQFAAASDAAYGYVDTPISNASPSKESVGRELPSTVTAGAQPKEKPAVQVSFYDQAGKKQGKDLRVKILVPNNYWSALTVGPNNILKNLNGIIFPYTPSISYDVKADYSSTSPIHSNFPINFYQKSTIGNISITGKFSVESTTDAGVLLSTIHLLRALTKMRSGGRTGDLDSGSPPPVCRLMAHGDYGLHNVPVAVSNFRVELPDSVDYFTLLNDVIYGSTSVPTMSTIAVTLTPMYSRAEMQKFNVTGYLGLGSELQKKGYL